MFNERYHSMMCSNRALEKSFKHLQNVQIPNPSGHQYVNDSILQVINLLFQKLTHASGICDKNGLKKETKYLVKKSFDMYALKFLQHSTQDMFFAAFNFLFMAVKFLEDQEIQSIMTLNKLFENPESDQNYQMIQKFKEFEIQMFSLPDFDLNFTTPYDYLGLYKLAFLLDEKMVKRIQKVLDFSLTIPDLMFASAEELFFGAMLMIGEKKNYEKEWILRQTFSRKEAEIVGSTIKYWYYRQMEAAQIEARQN